MSFELDLDQAFPNRRPLNDEEIRQIPHTFSQAFYTEQQDSWYYFAVCNQEFWARQPSGTWRTENEDRILTTQDILAECTYLEFITDLDPIGATGEFNDKLIRG